MQTVKYYLFPVFVVLLFSCGVEKDSKNSCLLSSSAKNYTLVGKYYKVEEHNLPWKSGAKYFISSPPGNWSHVDHMAYAWDFLLRKDREKGAEVLSTVDSCVRSIKRDAKTTFGNRTNSHDVNYITMTWDKKISDAMYPGEKIESLYLHLAEIYPEVKVGACFKKGTALGITGCTGWCTGIHLHYQVQKQKPSGFFVNNSLPVQFAEMPPLKQATTPASKNKLLPIKKIETPPVLETDGLKSSGLYYAENGQPKPILEMESSCQ